jgi:hypothetical protein
MYRCLACLFLAVVTQIAWAADTPPPPVGDIIHDLRDFLPVTESTSGKADDPIPAFSTRDGAYWTKYRRYNTNGTGNLSRTELIAIVADLEKSLRVNYPEVYAAIDTDGDDTITLAKFSAYLNSKK